MTTRRQLVRFLCTAAGAAMTSAADRPKRDVIVRSKRPEDFETPLDAFDSWITPIDRFFVRSHMSRPEVDVAAWRLAVDGEVSTPLEHFAKTHTVLAVELQGHGRTADNDRPLSFETMGDDIAALLDQLNIPKADIVGLSLGAAVALRTAIQHPEKVRRLVVISSPYAKSGWYPEAQKGMGQVGAAMAGNMMQTPTGKFSKQWPEPQRFPQFLDKMGKMMGASYDWSADVKKLPMPVMLVFADNDSVSQKHIAEFFALLGGGVKEPGWQNTQLSKARLAIVPGYSHYNFVSAPELAPIIDKYLADPLTNLPAGAAAASQAAPELTKGQLGSEVFSRGEADS